MNYLFRASTSSELWKNGVCLAVQLSHVWGGVKMLAVAAPAGWDHSSAWPWIGRDELSQKLDVLLYIVHMVHLLIYVWPDCDVGCACYFAIMWASYGRRALRSSTTASTPGAIAWQQHLLDWIGPGTCLLIVGHQQQASCNLQKSKACYCPMCTTRIPNFMHLPFCM